MAKSDIESAIELRLPLPLLVFQLHSLLNAQARALISKRGNLSLAQWRVLRLISLDVAHTSTALRKLMGIDKSQFSKEISQLIADGYVTSAPYEADRRQQLLAMTDKGHAAYARIAPALDARQAHLMGALTDTQRNVMFEAIKALAEAAQRHDFDTDEEDNA
ncbi:MarR family winged helix-turn-helix transcriptional regulator [Pararhodobacter aggregans]|uniref:MarR family transcriptional regulator n=1 Tax=Pararhodobacter aggregans TaxID=404875 RepID=A0A2T7UMA3_9RHOB|nr:MarR family winged helix-turn-helix transcriptional regulator [Pararhodobacter aggregans]PTX00014.1 MarR family transcriptional regulator [Pararhodobacter aggregans]PVE45768.1 MarR family transcriptional regulator [Pararhodobacter aggregans]